MSKLVFIGEEEKEIPQFGVFKFNDEVDFDEKLLSTGLFTEKIDQTQNKKEDGVE